jgi:predicted transposase YdaD
MPDPAPSPNLVDLSLKALARRVPEAIFRLIGETPRPEQIRIIDPTVIVKELEADHVFVHEAEGEEPAWGLYLEYQQQPDRRRLRSWALKALTLSEHLDLDVLLMVLYLRKGDRATFPSYFRSRGGALSNRFEFECIRLWEHADRIRSGELPELAPLLILCEDAPVEEVLTEERELIRSAHLAPRVERELLAVAYLLGIRYATRRVLDAVFGEELPMLKDAGIISDWIEEARAQAAAEGYAKGRAEGRAVGSVEGQAEGERRAVRLLVNKRFGSIPPALAARIDTADAAWCEAFIEHALEVESLDELRY